jgi:hypothetical protein
MIFNTIDELKKYVSEELAKTDYTVLPDVFLKNKDEFISYRVTLRKLIISPNLCEILPQKPKAIW